MCLVSQHSNPFSIGTQTIRLHKSKVEERKAEQKKKRNEINTMKESTRLERCVNREKENKIYHKTSELDLFFLFRFHQTHSKDQLKLFQTR